MDYYDVTLMNPQVLIGLFIGAVMAFYFCALTMKAVGRAAGAMVEEVRRQFRAKPGIMTGEEKPDYARCVSISTGGRTTRNDFPIAHRYCGASLAVGLVFDVGGRTRFTYRRLGNRFCPRNYDGKRWRAHGITLKNSSKKANTKTNTVKKDQNPTKPLLSVIPSGIPSKIPPVPRLTS